MQSLMKFSSRTLTATLYVTVVTPSVAVTCTLYMPAAANLCAALWPVALPLPSPKSHSKPVTQEGSKPVAVALSPKLHWNVWSPQEKSYAFVPAAKLIDSLAMHGVVLFDVQPLGPANAAKTFCPGTIVRQPVWPTCTMAVVVTLSMGLLIVSDTL